MDERIKLLAMKAGFIFWSNESWRPEGAVIDWATDYDDSFKAFYKDLVSECAHLAMMYASQGYKPEQICEKICAFYDNEQYDDFEIVDDKDLDDEFID